MDNSVILQNLKNYKITYAQIDPFGFCNAKCWFCPVKYKSNPKEAVKHMDIGLFEKIIADIYEEKHKPDGIISSKLYFIFTAHYNEVLLYKHFEKMVEVLRKYKLTTMLLTNGVPLTPEKIDFIKNNLDVITGCHLNVPAFEAEIWSKRSGMNINLFDKLMANLAYANVHLAKLGRGLSLQINGVNDRSFTDAGGYITKGEAFPNDINLNERTGELATQLKLGTERFPNIRMHTVSGIIDRAGLLEDAKIFSNKPAIDKFIKKSHGQVVGCNNMSDKNGGRVYGWLHVNSLGKAFLCCNDYDFDYVFGDYNTQKLQDFWVSESHAEMIKKSFAEICTRCSAAVWSD